MITTVVDRTSEPPVTLQEAKHHLRVFDGVLDEHIQTLIEAATEYCESATGRAFRVSQTITQTYPEWPCRNRIEFDRHPVISVSHLKYYNADNALTTLDSSNYRLHTSRNAAAYLEFDSDFLGPDYFFREDAIVLTYLAGYGSIDYVAADDPDPAVLGVPELAKVAVLFTLELMFGNLPEGMIKSTTERRDSCLSSLDPGIYR